MLYTWDEPAEEKRNGDIRYYDTKFCTYDEQGTWNMKFILKKDYYVRDEDDFISFTV